VKRSEAQRVVDAERWVAARRRGVSVAAVAAAEGVGSGTVSRATAPFGPFREPLTVSPSQPDFLTVAQAAAELAVGSHVVRALIRGGDLPARRLGVRPYEVERGMFERWIAVQYRQTREWIAANPGAFVRNEEIEEEG